MRLLYAAIYVALWGLLSNPLARLLPRKFSPSRPPFAPWGFEKNGKLYEKLGIRKWKDAVPDVSRVLKYMTPKKIVSTARPQTEVLIQETIVAELVHFSLIFLSLGVLLFWRGPGAAAFLIVYNLLGNVPFIMIQRYNRPRLIRLAEREKRKNA